LKDLFEGVVGHGPVVDLLVADLARPAQAYLFVGPASVGKHLVASRFAVGLLVDPSDSPERQERARRLALSSSHPDLVVVEPEGAASLGVDQARDVIRRASMTPVEGARTVFLFPEAGAMTDQAANALLKTLEEPSPSVVFLLVAESEDDFPATVASRCRTVHMGRVPLEEMVAGLTAGGIEEARAESLAVVAAGRPGLAMSLATRPEVAGFREMWLSIPTKVTPHPGDGQRLASLVLQDLGPMVENAVDPEMPKEKAQRTRRRAESTLLVSGLEILASWYVDSASLQLGGPVRNPDIELTALTGVSARKAVRNAELALDAVTDIEANLRRELVLANLFASLGSD
jgi:DNA polymerase III subunit delta'